MVFELGIGKMPLQEIARSIGAEGAFSSQTPTRIVTDSREVRQGDLFCALRGENDGHKYIKEAQKNGAVGVIAERKSESTIPHLLCPDVQQALFQWAHEARLRQSGCRLIGITGSVGKTTTKTAINTVLSTHFSVFSSFGNYNNMLGVPLSLLSVPTKTQVAVLELGSNKMGEIETLSRLLSPDDAIITAIGHAHVGAFGNLKNTAKEKLGITAGLKKNGTLYIKKGEPYLQSKKIAVSIVQVVPYPGVSDIAMASALGFAEAVGRDYGLSETEIQKGLLEAKKKDIRRLVHKCGSITLIDDGYNASPESMLAAFSYLKAQKGKRKILVIGDMLELGKMSESLHRTIGHAAAFADAVFLFGQFAPIYYSAVNEKKSGIAHLLHGGEAHAYALEIFKYLEDNDTVLFKASHNLHTDQMVKELSFLLSNSTKV